MATSPPPPVPPSPPVPSVTSRGHLQSVSDSVRFSAEEETVLAHWDAISAFETSLANASGRPHFTFYDGPPFATGLPHYGHILAGTIKDIVTRYASQTGFYVSRRFGQHTSLHAAHPLPHRPPTLRESGLTFLPFSLCCVGAALGSAVLCSQAGTRMVSQ